MESETLGKVAFREAYKATSDDRQFCDKHWVIKRYTDSQNDILPACPKTSPSTQAGSKN